MKQKIQNILDRNFTRGDNAKALKELCDLFSVSGMLPADRGDAEEFLCGEKGICGHPHVQDSVTGNNDYEIADLMAEFANKYYGNYR